MNKIRSFYLVILFVLFSSKTFADNQVPNNSFENGQSCRPTAISQIDNNNGDCTSCLDDWENFNTSDWFTDKIGQPFLCNDGYLFNGQYDVTGGTAGYGSSYPVLLAQDGDYFAGFGACEGIQVKLKNKVGGFNKSIRISFWFSPRTREDTKIIVYLLSSAASDFSNCNNPGINTEVSFEIEVNSAGLDAIHQPGLWYYVEKSIFACPGDPVYEYLAIKGENGFTDTFGDRKYVYVDNFSLEEEDFCNHPCAISVGEASIFPPVNILNSNPPPQYIPNPDFPNATSGVPIYGYYWSVALYNIIGYKFTVFDMGWDGVYDGDPGIYHIQEFDPNGLTLPNGPMVVSWTGENNFGNCVPIGAYPYILEYWNCNNHEIVEQKTISYLGDGCSLIQPFVTPCFNDACTQRVCDPNLLLLTEPLSSIYQASNSVIAQTQFIVVPDQRVDITAGSEIILGDGFVAEEGSEFRARIAPCDASSQRLSGDSSVENTPQQAESTKMHVDTRRNSQVNSSNAKVITGSNISSDGIFIISISEQMEYDFSVYNSHGSLVFFTKNSKGELLVDLRNEADGLFYYVLHNDQIQINKGVLLKIE